MRFHCLFEQSGTFKNVFKSYRHEAFDYDILNDYGQTDFKIDLFREIELEYENINGGGKNETIFSSMQPEIDFIIAFFPCTYFTDMNEPLFKGYNGATKNERDIKKVNQIIKRNKDRALYFEVFLKFCLICQELKISTIIENPYGCYGRNYLKLFSPFEVNYTEMDRSKFGDKFKKPTIYFAINFEMQEHFAMFDLEINTINVWSAKKGKERSEITSRYADNFYKRFIKDWVENKSYKTEVERLEELPLFQLLKS